MQLRSLIVFLFGLSMGAGMVTLLLPPAPKAGSGQAGVAVDEMVRVLRREIEMKDGEIARLKMLAGTCEERQAVAAKPCSVAPVP